MAENSNDNENLEQKQQNLKNHARSSSPSFSSKNQYKGKVQGNPKAQAKKAVFKEGIKKAAQYYGVPEMATEKVLESEVGEKVLDAAASQPTIAGGVKEATKVITWETVIKPSLIASIGLFALLFSFIILIAGKDAFGGMGGEEDIYADLREEIGEVMQEYKGKGEINGTLILATLIAYNDNQELEEPGIVAKNMANMKKQVSKLASYQIMTIDDCSYDSSTMRKIASNDGIIGEENFNCMAGAELSYKVSYSEGNFDDDNSGSVYYWNLIDQDFIFEYYNEYMIDKDDNTVANEEKINDIISEIYSYYEMLMSQNDGKDYFSFYLSVSGYWWPIGSNETTVENGKVFAKGEPASTTITAWFAGNDKVHQGAHGAIDIAGTKNVHNVIATRSGTVIYPNSKSQTGYLDGCHSSAIGCTRSGDGGGFGNYVIIDHGDGVYSYYAHMYADTITVFAGDTVEQGQVIGKVGTSGNSTGPHLHFEIRDGGLDKTFRVDPLQYVDPNNPRPVGSAWAEWIKQIECASCDSDPNKFDGSNYIVYRTKEGSLDVAWGIRLVDPKGVDFKRYVTPDGSPIKEGTKIPKEAVYQIFDKLTQQFANQVNATKAKYGITLNDAQDMAMLSLAYNAPSRLDRVMKAYGSAGDTNALWNELKTIIKDEDGEVLLGLKRRRAEEFELFTTGDYNYNPLGGSKVKYYDVQNW